MGVGQRIQVKVDREKLLKQLQDGLAEDAEGKPKVDQQGKPTGEVVTQEEARDFVEQQKTVKELNKLIDNKTVEVEQKFIEARPGVIKKVTDTIISAANAAQPQVRFDGRYRYYEHERGSGDPGWIDVTPSVQNASDLEGKAELAIRVDVEVSIEASPLGVGGDVSFTTELVYRLRFGAKIEANPSINRRSHSCQSKPA